MKNIRKQLKRKLVLIVGYVLLIAMVMGLSACETTTPTVQAEDLMEDIEATQVEGKELDNTFVSNTADFTVELFKKSIDNNENSLVSPVSVMLALAMTANGADGETLAQMEQVLGRDISLDELNEYLYYLAENLPNEEKSKLDIANSIWLRDNESLVSIDNDFLTKNASYYNAEIYKSPFDENTLKAINKWVDLKTDGMIDSIIDRINEDSIMYLINAIAFDAEWKKPYNKEDIFQGEFSLADGTKMDSDFMRSTEGLYLDDGNATGFIKPYYNDKYSFVALLPNEDVALDDYINNLTGEGLIDTIANAEKVQVNATTPKFSYEYKTILNNVLADMGMPDAFSPAAANFQRMGKSSVADIYIGEVLHKTFISLDELGTKAGAVTSVEMRVTSAPLEIRTVTLDRPFVYAIIDNSSNLPIFIGTVMNLDN
jgi:serine protease inhibitor